MTTHHESLISDLNAVTVEYTREWELCFSDDGQRVYADPCPECGGADGFDLIWEIAEDRVGIQNAETTGEQVTMARGSAERRLTSAACTCCGARVLSTDGDGVPVDDDAGDR